MSLEIKQIEGGLEQGEIYVWHPIYNPDVALEVTKTGRSILSKMIETAEKSGFDVLIVDHISLIK